MDSLQSSVGIGCPNRRQDVQLVQSLLNNVPLHSGGPNKKLVVDGLAGRITVAAIKAFQQRQFGFADGIVSPGKQTIARLAQIAGTSSPPSSQSSLSLAAIAQEFVSHVQLIPLLVRRPHDLGPAWGILRTEATRLQRSLATLAPTPDRRLATVAVALPAGAAAGGVGGAGGLTLGGLSLGPIGAAFLVLAGLALVLRQRQAVVPKTDEERKLEVPLSQLEELILSLSVDQARQLHTQVRTIANDLGECGLRNLLNIAPGGKCFDLNELFKKIKNDLLRMLTQYIASPFRFPGLLRTINITLENFRKLANDLNKCLDCNLKIGQP